MLLEEGQAPGLALLQVLVGGRREQQRRYEVGQLFVCYVFALEMSGKYLKVTFSHTQKSVKFRSVFIFLQECQLIVGF